MVLAAGLLLLYLALVSTANLVEVAVGSVLASATATVAVVAARAFETSLAVPALRWRWLLTFPVDAGWDVIRLGQRLVGRAPSQRQRDGWWDSVELPTGAGRPDAVRAYAVLVVSLTPASYVSDVDVEEVSGRDGGRAPTDSPGRLRVRRWAPAGPVEKAIGS